VRLKTSKYLFHLELEVFAFQSYLLGGKAVWDFSIGHIGCLVGQQAIRDGKKVLVGQWWPPRSVPSQHFQPQIPWCRSGKPGFPGLSLRILPWITKIQCFLGRGEALDQLSDSVFGITSAMPVLLIPGDDRACPFRAIYGGEVLSIEN